MGNNKKAAVEEKKKKKKGRPSLLDLQRRSLRQQNQSETQSQNPSPNPYIRFPNSSRKSNRTNLEDDDEDERREKKLKLVVKLESSANSGPDDDDDAGNTKKGTKGTDFLQGEPSEPGPTTTPLPDKKLLEFILDRLQKKDTYGVFSEPVDPEELPDYHEIIEHPMDFATVRKKLSSGEYATLEQFEKDIFLISSNAMSYNAADTIYYRQARAINELAKKNFENLRQESDDNEPEPKTVVRRGRPPGKRTVGRPPADRAALDFSSNATLANASEGACWSNLTHEVPRKGSASDGPDIMGVPTRPSYNLRKTESFSWAGVQKQESNEENIGYAQRGASTKYGKRLPVRDENRRNTYMQPQPPTSAHEPSVLPTFDRDKNYFMPVGLRMEYAYARSLARFAANLGPVGWAIAAKKIERVLPPGTKFGRGWVGDSEAPQQSQQPLLSSSPLHPSSQPNIPPCTAILQGDELPKLRESTSNDSTTERGHFGRTLPLPVSTHSAPTSSNKPFESMDIGAKSTRGLKYEGCLNLPNGCEDRGSNIQAKAAFHLQQNPGTPFSSDCYSGAFGFNLPAQVGTITRPTRLPGPFFPDAAMTHARTLDMVSKGSTNGTFIHQTSMNNLLDAERAKLNSSLSATLNPGSSLPDTCHVQDTQCSWQNLSQQTMHESVPPDLNVRFQSPGSPAGVMVDSQQPDLVLQL